MKKLPWISILIQTCIGGIILLSIFGVIALYMGWHMENPEKTGRCEAFCNCSISDSCPYTFDYDDVKDCDCNIGGE